MTTKYGKLYIKDSSGNIYDIVPEILSPTTEYVGATSSSNGVAGLVPPATSSEKDLFLKGDGSYGSPSLTLPTTTSSSLGGVIVGSGLNVDSSGTISVDTSSVLSNVAIDSTVVHISGAETISGHKTFSSGLTAPYAFIGSEGINGTYSGGLTINGFEAMVASNAHIVLNSNHAAIYGDGGSNSGYVSIDGKYGVFLTGSSAVVDQKLKVLNNGIDISGNYANINYTINSGYSQGIIIGKDGNTGYTSGMYGDFVIRRYYEEEGAQLILAGTSNIVSGGPFILATGTGSAKYLIGSANGTLGWTGDTIKINNSTAVLSPMSAGSIIRLQASTNDSDKFIQVNGSTGNIGVNTNFAPIINNSYTLGLSANRWNIIYGGTGDFTGNVTIANTGNVCFVTSNTSSTRKIDLRTQNNGNAGIWDTTNNRWMIHATSGGTTEIVGDLNVTSKVSATSFVGVATSATNAGTATNATSFGGYTSATLATKFGTYLPLAGGTMTGNITMSGGKAILLDMGSTVPTVSVPRNIPLGIKTLSTNSTSTTVQTKYPFYEIPAADPANGIGIGMGVGGLTAITAGEARSIISAKGYTGDTETVVFAADAGYHFYTSCQTIASAIEAFEITGDGNLYLHARNKEKGSTDLNGARVLAFTDKTGNAHADRLASIELGITSTGSNYTYLRAYQDTSGSTSNVALGVVYFTSGTTSSGWTYAPTPTAGDNSTKIATTAFVKNASVASATTAGNVTGTVAIANGGTGATTRLNAFKNINTENVGTSATHLIGFVSGWTKCGYVSVANAKTVLGISGSDRRIKDDISQLPDELLDMWEDVVWKQFKFKKDIQKDGESAPISVGAIVQDIQQIFANTNIDLSKYGFIYHEDWDEEEKDLLCEENPEITNKEKWYLKYDQLLCIEAAYQRRRANKAEERIANLEKRLEKLENIINKEE